MRVLFSVSSWPTHYASMVPLGWALRASGHEVRVLCAPSQTDSVTRAGLQPVPVLDGMDVAVHNRMSYVREALSGNWPYPWLPLHPVTGAVMSALGDFDFADYRRTTEPEYARRAAQGHDRAVWFARRWRPDLVVHDPVSTEGPLAARDLGVPAVLALWGPVGTHEADGPDILAEEVSGSFERYGHGPFGADSIEYVIDPCPGALEPPVKASRLPVRFVPYNGGGIAPDWLDEPARGARIAVTWSTALTSMSGADSYLLPRIVAALAGLDAEVVLTGTPDDVAALGEVPPSVRVLENCPLSALLAHSDLVLHHGGAGSTMTALAAGVPQLAVTFASEQARVAERMSEAGAGRQLPGHLATREAIRSAVEELLDRPGHLRAAWRLREDNLRRPTPVRLVERLVRLTRG
ncbi:UDP:flavonoid glycosyltransferase YjiC (YdhE family) [Streptomyces umbrinus]|uniref:UDP:flavonoid glycosyltransferase YjiC (YdhE family) n=1 Tax=Streptomyces umbrinus TaxID=67370 RepID=A0ABU0SNE6_9ACTN|nr:nucleotide disphospho-sugar-binding domain-containing protein [Streptomyces umbrinus]MDQ1025058.1 UDP:flavonoid glycosyltransferase YjiC (YdhE family) [Streptomyces umbrinus]